MSDQLYKEIILEHWQHPQNYGSLDDADIDITEGNPLCGDELRLTIKLQNNKIGAILFVSEGCAISKASASLLTEEMKGKRIEDIQKLQPQDVLNLLGVQLTPTRTKCALLVYQALKKASPAI